MNDDVVLPALALTNTTFMPAFAAPDGAQFLTGVNASRVMNKDDGARPALHVVGFYVATPDGGDIRVAYVMQPDHALRLAEEIMNLVDRLKS